MGIKKKIQLAGQRQSRGESRRWRGPKKEKFNRRGARKPHAKGVEQKLTLPGKRGTVALCGRSRGVQSGGENRTRTPSQQTFSLEKQDKKEKVLICESKRDTQRRRKGGGDFLCQILEGWRGRGRRLRCSRKNNAKEEVGVVGKTSAGKGEKKTGGPSRGGLEKQTLGAQTRNLMLGARLKKKKNLELLKGQRQNDEQGNDHQKQNKTSWGWGVTRRDVGGGAKKNDHVPGTQMWVGQKN